MKKTVRNSMLVLGLGAFLAFGASACGGKEAKQAEKLAKDACACKDKLKPGSDGKVKPEAKAEAKTCGDGVLGKFKDFMIKNKDKKVSKKNAERAGKAAKKMTECLMKAGVPAQQIEQTMLAIRKGG